MKIPTETKPALFGAVAGAALAAIIGFSWGGWVTGSTADQMAETRADRAVVMALTPICVANFNNGTDAATHLAALKEAKSWEQGNLVKDGGWATMPGGATVSTDLARACATALTEGT
ncbi:MAG: hypothetical protein RIB84_15895 [Sneathiellaceae bacterium]